MCVSIFVPISIPVCIPYLERIVMMCMSIFTEDPVTPCVAYQKGLWDFVTVLSFATIMLVWINGVSFSLKV